MDNPPPEQINPPPDAPPALVPLADPPVEFLPPPEPEIDLAAIAAERERRAHHAAYWRGVFLSSVVFLFSFGLYFFCAASVHYFNLTNIFIEEKVGPKIPNPLEHPENLTILQGVAYGSWFLMVLVGAAVSFLALICGAIDPIYGWLKSLFFDLPRRPLPEFTLVDFIAVFSLIFALTLLFHVIGATFFGLRSDADLIGMQMLAHDAAMMVAILAGVAIAAVRARSMTGALGFWTAWSSERIDPVKPLWHDVALGLGCFFFSRWVLLVTGLLYSKIVSPPDDHLIVTQIAAHPKAWVLSAIIFAGTFGAAFFEETLYRGMLFPALRRILGGVAAAIIGAAIFAVLHGFQMDLLSLFTLGLIMTWLYVKTGRLLAGIVFHFANNAFAFIILLISYY